MAVVGAVLLLSVDRDLGAVHVQHHPLRGIDGFRLSDQSPVDCFQTSKVLVSREHFSFERLEPGREGCATLPDLF